VATLPGHAHPIGYAQVSRSETSDSEWSLELVIAPHHREDESIASELVEEALRLVVVEGGGRVNLWVSKPQPWHDRVAGAHGLRRGRDLYQLRRPLPTGIPYDLDWRPFEPGRDEEAWLEVNNAAFASHREQGEWTREVLAEREALDWFDPAGFLLHEGDEGRLDGFCWTKVHADHDPPLGEIYVIGVAPWAQRKGLGRRLTLAGLDFLAGRGIGTGMLYVDAANAPAVKLYVDLGFTLDHVDRAYSTTV
jgi:mycothiol synthase